MTLLSTPSPPPPGEYQSLVRPDSLLIKVPTAIITRQRLLIDGLRYCFQVIDVAYPRLVATLRAAPDRVRTPSSFAPAFADAWCVVDAANRVRGLLKALPIAWADAAREARFKATMRPLNAIRNGSHHLDDPRLAKLEADRLPVWGRLSWVRGNGTGLVVVWNSMFSGAIPGEYTDVTGVIDLHTLDALAAEYDGHLQLHAFGETCLFSGVIAELREIVADVERALEAIRSTQPATSSSDFYVRGEFRRGAPPGSSALDLRRPGGDQST